ncbi:MAG: hypothetical protein KIT48_19490 [Pseudolabrys sp.]|nr:hypothetical protein [Pseudolabrys sp.]
MSDNLIEEIAALADGEQTPLAPEADDTVARPADGQAAEADSGPRTWGYDVDAINRDYALVLWGGKAVVVRERPDGPIEDRVRVLSVEAFDQWFANRFTEITTADGKVRAISWGRAWRTDRRRRQYAGIEFFPNPDGAEGTRDYLNLWRGLAIEPTAAGDYSIFRDHLLNQVCQGDQAIFDWVFGWFAHIVQRPRERIGTALVLRGRMGTGKTKVGEVIGSLLPAHYFQVDDPRYITGQFNAHMASCLLLQAEEAVWAGDKHAEGRLKGLITSESQMIESKGVDPIRIRNFVRLMMTSNEDWVVPAGMDERRFCVLDVHPRCAQNHDYFREMDEQLAAGGRARLLRDLLAFDLSKVNLRQIPRTEALLEQKVRSLDPLDGWWLARLMDGTATSRSADWPATVTIDALYADYLRAAEEIGVGRKRDRATFGHRLSKLVPGIKKTRPRAEGEGRRPWCYLLPPLADCRGDFEGMVGQPIEWPPLPASEKEISASDEVVPL